MIGRPLPLRTIRVRNFTSNTCFGKAAHDVSGFSAPVTLADGLILTLRK